MFIHKKTVYELDTVDKSAIKKSKKERDRSSKNLHQQLQHQISRVMVLPTPILVDKTNANTGCEGEMVAILEKKNFNLHTIGSSLHHDNFRALSKNIDGCAKGSTAFCGPLGKLSSKDCHDLPQISFSTISRPLDSILKIDEIHDLSCDQRFLYEYAVGISRGNVDSRYASWKIGPLNQARWLTLVFMDSWCIPTKAHNKTPQFNKFYRKYVCQLFVWN